MVGFAWGLAVAALEVLSNVWFGPVQVRWQEASGRSWDGALAAGAAAGAMAAFLTNYWLHTRRARWIRIAAWLGIGAAAAVAAASGITLDVAVTAVARGGQLSQVALSSLFLWLLVVIVALPQTLVIATLTAPLLLFVDMSAEMPQSQQGNMNV